MAGGSWISLPSKRELRPTAEQISDRLTIWLDSKRNPPDGHQCCQGVLLWYFAEVRGELFGMVQKGVTILRDRHRCHPELAAPRRPINNELATAFGNTATATTWRNNVAPGKQHASFTSICAARGSVELVIIGRASGVKLQRTSPRPK